MKQPARTIKVFHSYNFRDKDPIIDRLRTIIQGLGISLEEVSKATRGDVSVSALRAWFAGKTISPRYCSIVRVVIGLRKYDQSINPPIYNQRAKKKPRSDLPKVVRLLDGLPSRLH